MLRNALCPAFSTWAALPLSFGFLVVGAAGLRLHVDGEPILGTPSQ